MHVKQCERLGALGGYHAMPSLEEARKARLLLFLGQDLESLHTGDQRADLPQQYAKAEVSHLYAEGAEAAHAERPFA